MGTCLYKVNPSGTAVTRIYNTDLYDLLSPYGSEVTQYYIDKAEFDTIWHEFIDGLSKRSSRDNVWLLASLIEIAAALSKEEYGLDLQAW